MLLEIFAIATCNTAIKQLSLVKSFARYSAELRLD